MRLSRNTSIVALAMLACGDDATPPNSPVDPPPSIVQVLTARVDGGNGQSGVVAAMLNHPLAVRVYLDGAPAKGIKVRWTASGGTIPTITETDRWGIARAAWTLGPIAGSQRAAAHLSAANGRTVLSLPFDATARAAPTSRLQVVGSASGSAIANAADGFHPWSPTVRPLDAYGNAALDTAVMFTILDGPVASLIPLHDLRFAGNANGIISTVFKPIGEPGVARVRAYVPGTAAHVDFTLSVLPPQYVVHIYDYQYDGLPFFVSQQNRSGAQYFSAATDTVPLGAKVRWVSRFWESYPPQQVISLDEDGFPPSPPLRRGEWYEVVFNRVGTFRYANATDPSIPAGVIVVR